MNSSTDLHISIVAVEVSQNFNAQFPADESETNINCTKNTGYLPILMNVSIYAEILNNALSRGRHITLGH